MDIHKYIVKADITIREALIALNALSSDALTLFVIDRRNRKYDCNYIFLYFVGGFLLHIVWEAKSQYVYPYVFILLPCCAWEMTSISDRIQRKVKTHDTKEKML